MARTITYRYLKYLFYAAIGGMILVGIAGLVGQERPISPVSPTQVEQTVQAQVNIHLTQTAIAATATPMPDVEATVAARLAGTPAPTSPSTQDDQTSQDFWNSITEWLESTFSSIVEWLESAFEPVKEWLENTLGPFWEWFMTATSSVVRAVCCCTLMLCLAGVVMKIVT